jgi:alginate O-acetyltransferase complex protein AlgI
MNSVEINLAYAIPLILIAYYFTSRFLLVNNLILLAGGLLLYSWGHPAWGLLLFFLTALDYLLVKVLFPSKKYRKFALGIGLVVNISTWLLCKYSSSISGGWIMSVGLPLGITFYMLRKISYLLDAYSGKFNLPHNFLDYALYVSFFPQIYSGPLERADDFIAQIRKPRSLAWDHLAKALPLLLMGLFKKIVVADNLKMIVTRIFNLDSPSRLLLAAGSFGFAFEIYADFSGYTDISRGFSYLLGFETSENFNSPYLALSFQDFWNRWHITFSSWLRDYIFFPLRRLSLQLSGERTKILADLLPPVMTMLVSGIWHGTGWTYLAWGLYHGVWMAVFQVSGLNRAAAGGNRFNKVILWVVTFTLIVFGWAIFRAPNLAWLLNVLVHSTWGVSGDQKIALLSIVPMIFIYILPLLLQYLIKVSGKARSVLEPAFYAVVLTLLVIFAASGVQDFVYTTF